MAKQWFPAYWGDYIRDTADLPMIQHGAYWLLLGHLYTTRRPIPPESLYRIAHAHEADERAAVDAVVARFWTMTKTGYVQARAMREIQKAAALETRASRGGHARWHGKDELDLEPAHSLDDAKPDASAQPPHPHPHPLPEPPPPHQDSGGKTAAGARPMDPIWDTLLEVCGVKAGDKITPPARGAYNKAVKDLKAVGATPEEIRRRARIFAVRWGDKITPTALVRRWNECTTNTGAPLTKTPKQVADEQLAQDLAQARREQKQWKLREQMRGEDADAFVARIRREAGEAMLDASRRDRK